MKKQTSSTNSNTDCRAKIKNALRRQQQQLLVKLNQNTPKEKKKTRSNSTSAPKIEPSLNALISGASELFQDMTTF